VQDTRRIEVNQFLLLAVSGYHDARPDEDSGEMADFSRSGPSGVEVRRAAEEGLWVVSLIWTVLVFIHG
jgi:hypothetical protein